YCYSPSLSLLLLIFLHIYGVRYSFSSHCACFSPYIDFQNLFVVKLVSEHNMTTYMQSLHSEVLNGFDFSNYSRNEWLHSLPTEKGGFPQPSYLKTGTTICGIICGKDAVIFGTDTRATMGNVVADKNSLKLHDVTDCIAAGGAGTAADLEHTMSWLSHKAKLLSMNMRSSPRIKGVVNILLNELFRYQGHKGCAVIIGGIDVNGPALYQVAPHGSFHPSPFASMGSGSLSALAILETEYRENLTIEEGKALVIRAIRGGILNDLGSGSNVDICVVTKEGKKMTRAIETPVASLLRVPKRIEFELGTTAIIRERAENLKKAMNIIEEDVEMHPSA
ncbi:putative proteasome subunit beta type 7 precursor, partial [Cardiosporidium cionae]